MLRILLSLMTLVAVAAESAGQPPAATAPPSATAPSAAAPAAPAVAPPPVATCPATCPAHATAETCETPPWLGEPYRLVPARMDADGKIIFRRQETLADPVPCVALKKAADGSTTEEPRMADLFKPSIVVVHETVNPADVAWFDRNGKPVDAEAVGKQLATWRPVLVLPRARESYFQGEPEQTLLECFPPDLLIAVVSTKTHASAGQEKSAANGPVPASPIPTRARMDEKGRVIFRPTLAKAVWETMTKEIYESTETGQKSRRVTWQIMIPLVVVSRDELAVESQHVHFFDVAGNPIDAATAAKRLANETTVLVSADGEKVNAFYLKAVQPGTLVCVVPFDISTDISTARTVPAPPKAAPAPPCTAPAKAPNEEAAPLPAAAPKVSPPPSPDTAAGLPAFDEKEAKEQQEAWAKQLGVPVIQTNSIGMKLALIPPGEFMMGSSKEFIEEETRALVRADLGWVVRPVMGEGPQHRVRITKPFYMGIHEVTVGQFRKFVADAGYKTQAEQDGKGSWGYDGKDWAQKPEYSWQNTGIPQTDDHPVFNLSWNDAAAFCEWLSRKEGQTLRLPTEAEWEYACRAGTSTRYYFGDTDALLENHAWFDKNWRGGVSVTCVHPVGQKLPNPWGLFDIYGNVWEWCADWYGNDYYTKSPVDDPRGPDSGYDTNNFTGPGHVLRGGSSSYASLVNRSAYRTSQKPDRLYPGHIGFRVVCEVTSGAAAGSPSSAKAGTGGQAANGTQANEGKVPQTIHASCDAAGKSACLWLGYNVSEPVGDAVSKFAKHANVVVDYTWAKYGDGTIVAAKKAGLKVVLGSHHKPGETSLQDQALEMAGHHRDVVFAVCWGSPNYAGATPADLVAFGRRLKAALPGVEFWCDFVEAPRGNMVPMDVPDEVDRFIVTFHCSPNSRQIELWELSILPKWLEKAHGRPVLLGWSNWDPSPPGIAGRCEAGTMQRCAKVIRDHRLAGLTIKNYGKCGAYDGVETNPKLVAEIEEIARDWGIGSAAVPPAVAPLDEKNAKACQEASAKYLGVPVVQTNSIGMKLALIPPGNFDMGSPKELIEEELRTHTGDGFYMERLPSEGPRHRVRIPKPYWLGATEVTQEEYQRVMGSNPSKFQGDPRRPVEQVSWDDAVEFCRRLSELPAETTAKRLYRLPTEAEWEHASRAGTTTRYCFGDNEALLGTHAWFKDNSNGTPNPVGQKLPNPWGLFDIVGNEWEWCADRYCKDYYGSSPVDDPRGPDSGNDRVLRGGSWGDGPGVTRSAFRSWSAPDHRCYLIGFRVACEIPLDAAADSTSSAKADTGGQAAGGAPAPISAPAKAPTPVPTRTVP